MLNNELYIVTWDPFKIGYQCYHYFSYEFSHAKHKESLLIVLISVFVIMDS